MTIEFVDNTVAHRFELRSGDEVLGFLVYRLAGDHITMVHTEVDAAHGGHGYAAQLARGALDDARERGLPVVASCPYVASYVTKHPEYADLLVGPGRDV